MTYIPKVYRAKGGDELHLKYDAKMVVDGYAAGAGLSEFWDDCPIFQMALDPTLGFFVGDNFVHFNPVTANDYVFSGANGTFASVPAVMQGQAVITAPGTDNDECFLTPNANGAGLIKADAVSDWWFETRIKISQITVEQGVFVGLAEEAGGVGADFMTNDTMAMKVVDAIGFQIVHATAAAAIWQTIIQLNGGARVAIDATAGAAAGVATTDWIKLGMKSVLGTVTFYMDGVANTVGTTSAATNFPLNQVMLPCWATKTGAGSANSLTIDWWYAAQLR